MPPFPENPPALYLEDFDEPYYLYGSTNLSVSYGGLILTQSWSGYAMRSIGSSGPLTIPAVSGGQTNVNSGGAGSLRFWVTTLWSSSTVTNGSGPGSAVLFAELAATGGGQILEIWSLRCSSDGNTLALIAQTDGGPVTLLSGSISWSAGSPHCLGLNWGGSTALYVDGQLVASGSGTTNAPPSAAELVLGGGHDGGALAKAEFDEVFLFGRAQTEAEESEYYEAFAGLAAMGLASPPGGGGFESNAEFGWNGGYELDSFTCVSGGPVYLTNVLCIFNTNTLWTASFDIVGGTNTTAYDIFTVVGLVGNNITNAQWSWLGQGFSCYHYDFYLQPSNASFYVLGDQGVDPDGDGLSSAYELLVSKTDPNSFTTLAHDGYGTPDAWYLLHGLNPLQAGIGDADGDGDGLVNWQEYRRGNDPQSNEGLAVWVGMPTGLGGVP